MDPSSNSTTDPLFCETNADCLNHGICNSATCICYTLWTGKQCETNKVDVSTNIFVFFWTQNAFSAALFLSVAIAAAVQISRLVERKRKYNRSDYATWVLFVLIAFIGVERIIYLTLDPYRYRGIIGAVAESILFGLATWGFVCIYLIILVIWMQMYSSAKNSNQAIVKIIKYILVLMGSVFVAQIVYDIIRALFAAGQGRTIALILAALATSVTFLVYGRLLYKRLSKFKEHDPTRQKKLDKIRIELQLTKLSQVMRFTTAASIIIIAYSVSLMSLLVVTLVYGEDVLVFLIVHFLERLIEFSGCLAILITHHVNINRYRIGMTTGGSTNNNSGVNIGSRTTAVKSSGTASSYREDN